MPDAIRYAGRGGFVHIATIPEGYTGRLTWRGDIIAIADDKPPVWFDKETKTWDTILLPGFEPVLVEQKEIQS